MALHQACLVSNEWQHLLLRSLFQAAGRPIGSEGVGRREQRSGQRSARTCTSRGEISSLNTTCFGPSARQRLGGGWLEGPRSGGWEGGYAEEPFLPQEHLHQFLLASSFYNSRGVTVGWFDSKIVIFLLQKCLGQNQLLTKSLPQKWSGLPRGQEVPIPVPA